jgi:hypothetical protein
VLSDDFNDNTRGPYWSQIEDNAPQISVDEVNARLEGQASTSAASHEDAMYLSDGPGGFAVSTAADFQAEIDYAFTDVIGAGSTPGIAGLQFGVGTDASGDDSAGIALGIVSNGTFAIAAVGVSNRVNNIGSAITPVAGGNTGTFYISYDADTDALTLSTAGYGVGGHTYAGLVQGTWGADELLVGFGVRGGGVRIDPGEAWFDNFELTTGVVPEPASVGVLALGAALLLVKRKSAKPRAA